MGDTKSPDPKDTEATLLAGQHPLCAPLWVSAASLHHNTHPACV